jgi:hypothetical protein
MSENFKRIANLIGSYLNSIGVPYTFIHVQSEHKISVEYTCGEHVITVNMSLNTIWGRVHSGCLLSPMYRLLDKLEDFKKCIRTKCILERIDEI